MGWVNASAAPGRDLTKSDIPHVNARNYSSVQNAITDAASKGRAVYLPSGNYDGSGITCSAGVSVFGDGPTKSILETDSSGDAITIGGHYVSLRDLSIQQSVSETGKGVVGSDKYFFYTQNIQVIGFEYGMYFDKALYHYHERSWFENGANGARYFGASGTWNVDWYNNVLLFANCRFNHNSAKGLYAKTVNCVAIDCDFSEAQVGAEFVGESSSQLASGIVLIAPYAEGTDSVLEFSYAKARVSGMIAQGDAIGTPLDSIVIADNYSVVEIDGISPKDYWTSQYAATNHSRIIVSGNSTAFGATNLSDASSSLEGDVSGSFTATLTGVTGSVTATATYNISGRQVTIYLPSMTGTSNSTASTITGFPDKIVPASNQIKYDRVINDGADNFAVLIVNAAGYINLYPNTSFGNFEATGTKGVSGLSLTYIL